MQSPLWHSRRRPQSVAERSGRSSSRETIRRGVIMPSLVVSYSHQDADIDRTIEAIDGALEVYARALIEGPERYLVGPPSRTVFDRWRRGPLALPAPEPPWRHSSLPMQSFPDGPGEPGRGIIRAYLTMTNQIYKVRLRRGHHGARERVEQRS